MASKVRLWRDNKDNKKIIKIMKNQRVKIFFWHVCCSYNFLFSLNIRVVCAWVYCKISLSIRHVKPIAILVLSETLAFLRIPKMKCKQPFCTFWTLEISETFRHWPWTTSPWFKRDSIKELQSKGFTSLLRRCLVL